MRFSRIPDNRPAKQHTIFTKLPIPVTTSVSLKAHLSGSHLAFPGEVKNREHGSYFRDQLFKVSGRKVFRYEWAETKSIDDAWFQLPTPLPFEYKGSRKKRHSCPLWNRI